MIFQFIGWKYKLRMKLLQQEIKTFVNTKRKPSAITVIQVEKINKKLYLFVLHEKFDEIFFINELTLIKSYDSMILNPEYVVKKE